MGAGMSSHVLAPAASKNPGYDPIRDFTHIAFFGGAPSVLLVHPSLGINSFADLVALVRRSTGIEIRLVRHRHRRQHPGRIHCVPGADQAGACSLPQRQRGGSSICWPGG
jgi:hypothetical protein